MPDSLEHYRDNLRHVIRPDVPTERYDAPSMPIEDYEALALLRRLREYADYELGPSDEHHDVARAYIEYINMCVRDEERPMFTLYAHTTVAVETLKGAVQSTSTYVPSEIIEALQDSVDALETTVWEQA